MCYSALEHLLCLELKIHGNRRGQAKEPLKKGTVLKNISHLTKRRKLYRMLPDLRKSESNLWSHTITKHKLASYHNKVAAILNFFTVERLFSLRN